MRCTPCVRDEDLELLDVRLVVLPRVVGLDTACPSTSADNASLNCESSLLGNGTRLPSTTGAGRAGCPGSTPCVTSGTPSRIVRATLLANVAAVAAAATPAPATIVPAASAAPASRTVHSTRMSLMDWQLSAHARRCRSDTKRWYLCSAYCTQCSQTSNPCMSWTFKQAACPMVAHSTQRRG